jgi:hypothetical protein
MHRSIASSLNSAISKLSLFTLFLLPVLLISCNKEAVSPETSSICVGKPGTGVAGNCPSRPSPQDDMKSTPINSPVPVAYDVLCFKQTNTLLISGIRCDPSSDIFKIPRKTNVKTYLKTKVSVQQGSEVFSSFKAENKGDKITMSEMESLAAQDSNIYAIGATTDLRQGPIIIYAIRVYLFNKVSGEFKVFGQGEFQDAGDDKSEFTFTTGDIETK